MCNQPTNQYRQVSKDNFPNVVRKVCEFTFSMIWMHYKTGTL